MADYRFKAGDEVMLINDTTSIALNMFDMSYKLPAGTIFKIKPAGVYEQRVNKLNVGNFYFVEPLDPNIPKHNIFTLKLKEEDLIPADTISKELYG